MAEKDGVELIAVVMAAPDYKARFVQSNSLINYGFSNCKVYKDNKKYQNKVNICCLLYTSSFQKKKRLTIVKATMR